MHMNASNPKITTAGALLSRFKRKIESVLQFQEDLSIISACRRQGINQNIQKTVTPFVNPQKIVHDRSMKQPQHTLRSTKGDL